MKLSKLTFKQNFKKFKKVYIIGMITILSLIVSIVLGIFGLAAYKFPVSENGQFLNQPQLIFINLTPQFAPIGSEVIDGGVVGQEVGILIKPLIADGNIRFVMGLISIILLINFLLLSFVAFFYFLQLVNVPERKKDKYEDSTKLIQKTN